MRHEPSAKRFLDFAMTTHPAKHSGSRSSARRPPTVVHDLQTLKGLLERA